MSQKPQQHQLLPAKDALSPSSIDELLKNTHEYDRAGRLLQAMFEYFKVKKADFNADLGVNSASAWSNCTMRIMQRYEAGIIEYMQKQNALQPPERRFSGEEFKILAQRFKDTCVISRTKLYDYEQLVTRPSDKTSSQQR